MTFNPSDTVPFRCLPDIGILSLSPLINSKLIIKTTDYTNELMSPLPHRRLVYSCPPRRI